MHFPPRARTGIRHAALLAASMLLADPPAAHAQGGHDGLLREGDLVFQHIPGEQGAALQLATRSEWTHVGLAFLDNGQWVVIEAVGPVKSTPMQEWLARSGGAHLVMRLRSAWGGFDPEALERLRQAARDCMGLPYDLEFRWDDRRMYCSELVWKVYEKALGVRLCEPVPMREHDLSHPVVQDIMMNRYGTSPPMDEPMVAPASLVRCGLLREAGKP